VWHSASLPHGLADVEEVTGEAGEGKEMSA
jgi:hypothetical protein